MEIVGKPKSVRAEWLEELLARLEEEGKVDINKLEAALHADGWLQRQQERVSCLALALVLIYGIFATESFLLFSIFCHNYDVAILPVLKLSQLGGSQIFATI